MAYINVDDLFIILVEDAIVFIKLWDVDICSDNHVHYNKYLSSLEYHSRSGKLSVPE
jgi:hypothetical protein